MKKPIIIIFVLALLIPILVPLLIRTYIAYVPSQMVGSIDGWLGFLGGYSGGFLAFISAYLIFRNDQKSKERTLLIIKAEPIIDVDVPDEEVEDTIDDYIIVFTTRSDTKMLDDHRGSLTTEYPVFKCTLKNISPNFANSIQIQLQHGKSDIQPWCYERKLNRYRQDDVISPLEGGERTSFNLQLEPVLLKGHKHLDFILSSINLRGTTEKQKLRLLFNRDATSFVFEHRT